MKVGIPKETKQGEGRVAATPDLVSALVRSGADVLVETGAGFTSGYADDKYALAGATVTGVESVWAESDLVIKVKEPVGYEIDRIRPGQTLFCYLHLAGDPVLTRRLLETGATAIAFETVEDRSGRLPLLEPMSEIAGRLSALWGFFLLQASQGGKGIVAGGLPGVPRANVLVLGGGTVGYHAASVAQGLGADVSIAERSVPRLRELERMLRDPFEGFLSTPEELSARTANADLVIGAVLVPGHAAPTLLGEEEVASMAHGSVICDVAIDQGACIATSRPTTHSEPTFERFGVIHQCITNLPGAVPATASRSLCNVTAPYVLALASSGMDEAFRRDAGFARGLNILEGEPHHEGVKESLNRSPEEFQRKVSA